MEWLSTSPVLAIFAFKSQGQYAWVGTAIFSLGFIFNAARYIKCFYLSLDPKG
jgi:hypothetical protein